jgi:general secretion pathway protein G
LQYPPQDYGNRIDAVQAVKDLPIMQFQINDYQLSNGSCPTSLANIGLTSMTGPWGNTYEYVNYVSNPPGFRRKDKNLNPLSTNYDLYSKGEDR